MSEVKIKELDKSLIHQANSNSTVSYTHLQTRELHDEDAGPDALLDLGENPLHHWAGSDGVTLSLIHI